MIIIVLLLILKILHDLSILQYHYSQGLVYLGSCRILSIHRSTQGIAIAVAEIVVLIQVDEAHFKVKDLQIA